MPVEQLAGIEGVDEALAADLHRRASEHIERENARLESESKALGVADEVVALGGMTPAMLVALGQKGIKSRDDVADLATDELVEAVDGALSEEDAAAIVMAARAHWFENEEKKD